MLHLDGRSFSGSGTIVRFGVPLAALAGQDIHLTHIRARRDPPGLRPQHLKAVDARNGFSTTFINVHPPWSLPHYFHASIISECRRSRVCSS